MHSWILFTWKLSSNCHKQHSSALVHVGASLSSLRQRKPVEIFKAESACVCSRPHYCTSDCTTCMKNTLSSSLDYCCHTGTASLSEQDIGMNTSLCFNAVKEKSLIVNSIDCCKCKLLQMQGCGKSCHIQMFFSRIVPWGGGGVRKCNIQTLLGRIHRIFGLLLRQEHQVRWLLGNRRHTKAPGRFGEWLYIKKCQRTIKNTSL